ncbi:MAG: GntR family transcriptional regulator [Candidatus Puniceispirillaceae bacterium]
MSTDWAAHDLIVQDHYGNNLSATARIRHILLAAITAGDIGPGARLKEIDLGQKLGVSRTPLREAIAGLKAEGILSIGDDGGLRVRKLGYQDIHALYQFRTELESMAAALAATQASPAEREFIAEIRARETSLVIADSDPAALAKINGQFHQSIALASHNSFLIETLQRLSTLMVLLGPTAYSLSARVREIGTEHDAINAAIQTHDPVAAKLAAGTHLQNAVKARLQIIATGHKENID